MTGLTVALATCRALPEWERDDRPLHEALRALGCTVRHPAWDDPDFDWEECDAVLVRTTWDYVGRIDEFRAWVDRVSTITRLENPPAVLQWNLDKRYLRDLERVGVECVPTLWIESPRDMADLDWLGWPSRFDPSGAGFLKPSVGATASGTVRFRPHESDVAESAIRAMLNAGHAALVQPYLASVEQLGERSAIVVDGRMTHAVVKRPQPGDYRVQDDWGGIDAPHEPDGDENRFISAVIDAVPHAIAASTGERPAFPLAYARIDWLTGPDGRPSLVELELVEPSLFLRHSPPAATALAEAVIARGRGGRHPHPVATGRHVRTAPDSAAGRVNRIST